MGSHIPHVSPGTGNIEIMRIPEPEVIGVIAQLQGEPIHRKIQAVAEPCPGIYIPEYDIQAIIQLTESSLVLVYQIRVEFQGLPPEPPFVQRNVDPPVNSQFAR